MEVKPIVYGNWPGKQPLKASINFVGSWEDFEKILAFLIKEYNSIIIDDLNGPDARVCTLNADGQIFKLIFDDPYGTEIVSTSIESDPIVKKICDDLEKRYYTIHGITTPAAK